MRRRPLGRTGLVVSELALGTFGLSGDGYGPVDEAEAERVVKRALEIGIDVFETSDAYGAGKMEALLQRALEGAPDAVVVTKVGIDRRTEPPYRHFHADYVEDAVRRSVKRLGRAPVVLLHHPSENAIHQREGLDTLKRLKQEGVVRAFGVAAAEEHVAQAALEFGAEVVELAYNLLHVGPLSRLTGDVMVSGAGVLARSVLAYGLLAGDWDGQREFPEGDHRQERWTKLELERRVADVENLRFLVKGDVRSLRGAAVRFALASHVVSAAVLGPRSVEQLESLVRETGGGPRYLPEDDLREVYRVLERTGVNA